MSIAPTLPGRASSAHSGLTSATLLRAVAWAAAWIVAHIVREVRIRRDMRLLAQMDDAMLRDIGLTRTEIEPAVRYGRPSLRP